MAIEIHSTAVIQAMARSLSVSDLIRMVDTLKQSGQAQSADTLYATWIQHNAEHPLLYAVLFNHSVFLSDAGRLEPAKAHLERAIALKPDFMPAYINLGRVYERLGQIGPAILQWSAALARMTAVDGNTVGYKTTALNQSARSLEGLSQDEAAENMLTQSLELDCQQREVAQHLIALRQRQCAWPVVQPTARVSHATLMRGMSPLSAAAYTDDPLLHLAQAWHYNLTDVGSPAQPCTEWPRAMAGGPRLRIGYVCSDFREHALGYLLTEVPGLHDRSAVEVFIYYCGVPSVDPLHRRFRATTDHWRDITALDDASAAQHILADGIQILVDLNGYTRDARLKLFALRPAPVIVNWLGYPGTMGSPYHHYLIADDWIVPPEHEHFYSERVVRLPCYQPSHRDRLVAPHRPTRAEVGLPEDAMVYCCFNGAHKITRFTFERWLMILDRVPGSILWLLSGSPAGNERLRAHAAQRGVAPERIHFAEKLANPAHLARYGLADLFLDTTPYGAHTTANDALWVGVPVLTLSGRSFASRVGGSLVRSAGLPELVVTSASDYVDLAVALGHDAERRQTLRDHLQRGRDTCALFDVPGLVRSLESLYRDMWHDCAAGLLPRPDLVNLDACLELGSQVNHECLEVQTLPDYEAWWRAQLARRDRVRPLQPDRRLWNVATPRG